MSILLERPLALFGLVLLQLLIMPDILIVENYKAIRFLDLVDTIPAIALPYLASGFGIFLLRQTFMSVPKELEEAAQDSAVIAMLQKKLAEARELLNQLEAELLPRCDELWEADKPVPIEDVEPSALTRVLRDSTEARSVYHIMCCESVEQLRARAHSTGPQSGE